MGRRWIQEKLIQMDIMKDNTKKHDAEIEEKEGIETKENKQQTTKELSGFRDREAAEQSKSHGHNQHLIASNP